MSRLLNETEINELMKRVPEWDHEGNAIEHTFEFDEFTDAIDFVNAVAEIAEDAAHHPDIDIRYTRVRVVLWTHDKNGLTENDFAVAEKINTLG